jgi:thiol-disulfide isomerase/thioredoxin
MKKLALTFCLLATFSMSSQFKFQANSLEGYNSFLLLAKEQKKPVIIDFVADWCGPCKKMDRELWKSEEFKKLNNYIFIEVDIDVNTVLSSRFRVSSIPRVIIQVANTQNDIFFDKLGYSSKNEYLRELQYFNSFNYSELYDNDDTFENMGNSYRNLFFKDISKKNTFLKLSSKYFRKALKANETKLNQLNLIYNQALLGQHKKAKKKLAKINVVDKEFSNSEQELIEKILIAASN